MPNARGDQAKLLACRQTTFGTAESAADGAFYVLPFYNYNVVPSGELASDEAKAPTRGAATMRRSITGSGPGVTSTWLR